MILLSQQVLALGALLLCSLLLSGCGIAHTVGGWLTELDTPTTALTQIGIVTKDNANGTSATAVDIVFVYNETAEKLLPKNAVDWFNGRNELSASLHQHIDVVAIEIPPTYLLESVTLPEDYADAVKVIAYANYLDKKGQKPIDLTDFVHPLLSLEAKSILLSEQD